MKRARAPRSKAIVLRGSLAVFPPWQVVQWIAQGAPEGVLQLECRREGHLRRARLHCRDGMLLSLTWEEGARRRVSRAELAPRSGRLGGVLVAGGALSVARLRLALALQAEERRAGAPPRPLGRSLVGAEAAAAVAHRMRVGPGRGAFGGTAYEDRGLAGARP